MKKFLFAVAALVFTFSAHAQQLKLDPTFSGSGSTSTSVAGASNQGNNQAVTFTAPANTTANTTSSMDYNGEYSVKNVPNVNAPPLTTSNDTCMGSTSAGVGLLGVGLTGGTTWTDTNCKRLKNARELWNMGMRKASLALMCRDDDNREALESSGFKCPEVGERPAHYDNVEVTVVSSSTTTSTPVALNPPPVPVDIQPAPVTSATIAQ